jgi:hypothetical protein
VVIKTEAMSEWRRYLNWRILTLAAGLGIMEVCSSNEMGAPNASHLEQKTTQPNRPKQTKISPGKRAYGHRTIYCVGQKRASDKLLSKCRYPCAILSSGVSSQMPAYHA